jgi:hypothetical protein
LFAGEFVGPRELGAFLIHALEYVFESAMPASDYFPAIQRSRNFVQ